MKLKMIAVQLRSLKLLSGSETSWENFDQDLKNTIFNLKQITESNIIQKEKKKYSPPVPPWKLIGTVTNHWNLKNST